MGNFGSKGINDIQQKNIGNKTEKNTMIWAKNNNLGPK